MNLRLERIHHVTYLSDTYVSPCARTCAKYTSARLKNRADENRLVGKRHFPRGQDRIRESRRLDWSLDEKLIGIPCGYKGSMGVFRQRLDRRLIDSPDLALILTLALEIIRFIRSRANLYSTIILRIANINFTRCCTARVITEAKSQI